MRSCIISKLKKECLELSIKFAIELGVSKVYIVQTDYSQNFKLNIDRLNKIAVSSMLQSNYPYMCVFEEVRGTENILKDLNYQVIVLDNIKTRSTGSENIDDRVVFIGPEGGFSSYERDLFEKNNIPSLKFNTPILRAETALVTALTKRYL